MCISDVCPHRGAPLHMGWVAEVEGHDCVVCPYHGWAFDSEGRLRDVPAAEKKVGVLSNSCCLSRPCLLPSSRKRH